MQMEHKPHDFTHEEGKVRRGDRGGMYWEKMAQKVGGKKKHFPYTF